MKNGLACIHCWRKAPHGATRCPKCGKPITRTISERFVLDELLSLRSDVATYKATDRREHRSVVVRILHPDVEKAVKDCFTSEARFLRDVAGTGPFPEFIDYDELSSHKTFYSVVSYVKGIPLSSAARKYGPAEIMDVFFEILGGVGKIHEKDFVCCNLQPEHILVTPEGEICIVDFKGIRNTGSHSHGIGYSGFKAPEQYLKLEPVSPSTDVFALGCILYYLFTRRVPYPETMFGKTSFDKALTPPSDLCRYVTPELEAVLLKCLDLHPERRYSNAKELQAALWKGFSGKTESGITPITAVHSSSKKGSAIELDAAGVPRRTSTAAAGTYPARTASATDFDKIIVNIVVAICITIIVGAAVLAIMHLYSEVRNSCSPAPRYYYVPIDAVKKSKDSLVRILSWPAAKVFVNDSMISEAPSMEEVSCPSGDVTFRIVSKTGLERVFSTWLAPGKYYEIKADLQDLTHSIKEIAMNAIRRPGALSHVFVITQMYCGCAMELYDSVLDGMNRIIDVHASALLEETDEYAPNKAASFHN
jgi:hypothetical protein